jgi:hypothetical protein
MAGFLGRNWTKILLSVTAICSVILIMKICQHALSWLDRPHAVRVFQSERSLLEQFVNKFPVYDAKMNQNEEYRRLAQELASHDITRIQYRGDCVVFLFGGLPPDDVQKIIYSRKGYRGLPTPPQHISGDCLLIEQTCLGNLWYFRAEGD